MKLLSVLESIKAWYGKLGNVGFNTLNTLNTKASWRKPSPAAELPDLNPGEGRGVSQLFLPKHILMINRRASVVHLMKQWEDINVKRIWLLWFVFHYQDNRIPSQTPPWLDGCFYKNEIRQNFEEWKDDACTTCECNVSTLSFLFNMDFHVLNAGSVARRIMTLLHLICKFGNTVNIFILEIISLINEIHIWFFFI